MGETDGHVQRQLWYTREVLYPRGTRTSSGSSEYGTAVTSATTHTLRISRLRQMQPVLGQAACR